MFTFTSTKMPFTFLRFGGFLPEDEFLVLGTDGLWEFVSNEEVVNLVRAAG